MVKNKNFISLRKMLKVSYKSYNLNYLQLVCFSFFTTTFNKLIQIVPAINKNIAYKPNVYLLPADNILIKMIMGLALQNI